MASTSGKNGMEKNTKAKSKTSQQKGKKKVVKKEVDIAVKNEVLLISIFAIAIFVFLCVIGMIQGIVASKIQYFMFGFFGLLAYVIPILVFLSVAFGISNKGNAIATIKLVSGIVLCFLAGILSYMLMKQESLLIENDWFSSIYSTSAQYKAGGGILFGTIAHMLYEMIGFGGTFFLTIVLAIISIVFITEKSFLTGVKKGGSYLLGVAKEDAARFKEYRGALEEDEFVFDEKEEIKAELKRREKREQKRIQEEQKIRRMDKKARGVLPISSVTLQEKENDTYVRADIHEITLQDIDLNESNHEKIHIVPAERNYKQLQEDNLKQNNTSYFEKNVGPELKEENAQMRSSFDGIESMPEPIMEAPIVERKSTKFSKEEKEEVRKEEEQIQKQVEKQEESVKKYTFPPLALLHKGEGTKGDSAMHLKETALRLQQTLQNFGVKVTITDISQGPSVTRYELQPEQGVKVSKIVGLSDDIKLNLAATDIRIEAPIPGKAAVGIEVPNKENSSVALRDLLESKEFKQFPSDLAFAVGKDIGGKVVVTDISKMPHLLIAGATGSGKSVCINTIIMSILYKADPADVKMIMIDPKVVELSVYNGIPHLMIPVVTDPKKASAALHWGVAEMTDRYQKFADMNVRDLKGYNKAAEAGKLDSEGNSIQKMPQIVIIVDELADLMMVAAGEVEESICRLAQLARAAGIHLIIATQRPSVDVITGLIKANMPSRVAFSVSSGVDSRTILDMNGAEKLLGKGDMLFYPQGYAKPARVQGAFVSDSEVSDVVDFLKNQMLGNTYHAEIEEKIKTTMQSGSLSSNVAGSGSEYDTYFAEAGRFVIEKDKASIGMLQRVFKIGFNRAARIVDQLENAGVVGAEEGTKPRKILMSMEQFENYLEDVI